MVCMSAPGHMPHGEWIASRKPPPRKPPTIDGVSRHAQERVFKRLGVRLPDATWKSIYAGICADAWAWQTNGKGRLYHVPVEVEGHPYTLPLAVHYSTGKPMITTAYDLLRG
jgi:hypothetical protein